MDASRSNRSGLARLTPFLAVMALVLLPTAASAQGSGFVERAVEALRSDPVYVDPAAESILSRADADALRARIPGLGAGDVYVAVLPREALDEVGGRITGLGEAIRTRLGRPGIHIVVAGNRLVAAGPEGSTVPQLATEAVQTGNDAASVLDNLFDRIAAAAADGDLVRDPADAQPRAGGMGAGVLLAVMGVIGVGAVLLFSRSNRRRKEQEQRELEEVRRTVLDDLVALGDALRAVDIDVRMPGADPRAAADYERGLALYQQASRELDQARRPQDVAAVTAAIDEGRYLAESARARAEGREPPQRRPPCFFDPRHGPSVADREWAPPGGAPRAVPVCAADAQRIDDGVEPQPRRVGVRGEEVPYWDAPGYYAPWYGGYFGGGGLLQGFLLGSLLSGGFGGWGPHHAGWGGWGAGWGGGDGGSDFGGGDFGGGDFGGGDFGGGDFGGGDFGGGGFGE